MRPREAKTSRRRLALATLAMAALTVLGGCSESPHAEAEQPDPLNALKADGAAPNPLKIGITPSAGKGTDALLKPLLDYLGERLGIAVTAVTAKSYDDLAVMVNNGKVEVGIFSPLAYVKAREGNGSAPLRALPIATVTRRGSPTYVGYLAVRKSDENLRTVKDLKGHSIAWVDKSSTSGYLYPRMLLRDKGIADVDAFFGEAVFANSHDKAVRMLNDKEVDVVAVASPFIDLTPQNPLTEQLGEKGALEATRVIAKTKRIPFDCVVARSDLSRQLASELRAALLAMNKYPATVEALENSWGMSGFVRPEGRYKSVAAALKHSSE